MERKFVLIAMMIVLFCADAFAGPFGRRGWLQKHVYDSLPARREKLKEERRTEQYRSNLQNDVCDKTKELREAASVFFVETVDFYYNYASLPNFTRFDVHWISYFAMTSYKKYLDEHGESIKNVNDLKEKANSLITKLENIESKFRNLEKIACSDKERNGCEIRKKMFFESKEKIMASYGDQLSFSGLVGDDLILRVDVLKDIFNCVTDINYVGSSAEDRNPEIRCFM